jgi:hypothetical protein
MCFVVLCREEHIQRFLSAEKARNESEPHRSRSASAIALHSYLFLCVVYLAFELEQKLAEALEQDRKVRSLNC